jgi:hypothetical protein
MKHFPAKLIGASAYHVPTTFFGYLQYALKPRPLFPIKKKM